MIHATDRKEVEASALWWEHQAKEPKIVTPNTLVIDLEEKTVIYKIHGSVDRLLNKWHSYVVTEDDYIDFLSRMTSGTAVPALFASHFRARHFLFLGHSLADWNFRVVLRNLKTPLQARLPPLVMKKTKTNGDPGNSISPKSTGAGVMGCSSCEYL